MKQDPISPQPDPVTIAASFAAADDIVALTPHGRGLINDSYLVRCRDGTAFLLQRLNPAVFPQPAALLQNLRLVSDHLRRQGEQSGAAIRRQAIKLLPTRQQQDYHYDEQGACWRALEFIENSRTLSAIEHQGQAFEAGGALGRFHRLLADLPPALLHDPLPTLHILPWALAHYQGLPTPADSGHDGAEVVFCREFIHRLQGQALALEQARARGLLVEQVIHGDPKLDNILFGSDNDLALALVDLDTIKPGLIHYDIGDCLRSCCNRAGESSSSPTGAEFDLELARALLSGYLEEMRPLLTSADFAFIYPAAHLITFELGLRFFSDYLEGNRYFKVDDPQHNLRRALNQFHLVESIERQQPDLQKIITELT
ncbi:phosphotransferase enzyme family protein [Desulfurivibrio sp. D14AmB]|uniref:phosphotransferase enzyme family protein n=1 Tax=Desulfurivibrio sp. D14AmB TaxID=3374370 RepID=UPI00376EF010